MSERRVKVIVKTKGGRTAWVAASCHTCCIGRAELANIDELDAAIERITVLMRLASCQHILEKVPA